MRFALKRSDLDDHVAWVAKSLPARPPMQALLGLKIDTADGLVTLSAFDYEQSARSTVSAQESEDGSVLVPGKLLADIVRALPQDTVQFDVEGSRVVLKCGPARFTLPTLAIDDYPALPDQPAAMGTVDPDVLAEAVRQVAVAASRDDTLPVLTGVRVEVDPAASELTLVATDRYRLAKRTIAFVPADGSQASELLVPGKALSDFARTMGSDAQIVLGAEPGGGSGMFSVANDNRTATSRLLEGEFPAYARLLPTEFAGTATVPVAALTEAVRRSQLVANRSTPCRLSFSAGSLLLEAGASDDAQAREEIAVAYEGEPISISFNHSYLLDGLAAVGTSDAVFSLTAATRPATLTPAGDDTGFLYLLMPVRQQG